MAKITDSPIIKRALALVIADQEVNHLARELEAESGPYGKAGLALRSHFRRLRPYRATWERRKRTGRTTDTWTEFQEAVPLCFRAKDGTPADEAAQEAVSLGLLPDGSDDREFLETFHQEMKIDYREVAREEIQRQREEAKTCQMCRNAEATYGCTPEIGRWANDALATGYFMGDAPAEAAEGILAHGYRLLCPACLAELCRVLAEFYVYAKREVEKRENEK